jgi:hypothetical protein
MRFRLQSIRLFVLREEISAEEWTTCGYSSTLYRRQDVSAPDRASAVEESLRAGNAFVHDRSNNHQNPRVSATLSTRSSPCTMQMSLVQHGKHNTLYTLVLTCCLLPKIFLSEDAAIRVRRRVVNVTTRSIYV